MSRYRTVVAAGVVALIAGAGAATAATATPAAAPAAPACSTPWGTGAKGVIPVTMNTGPITNVRSGRHACFDRFVIDINGNVANRGVRVEYVPQVVQDGSGDPVPLRGSAKLRVIVGHTTYNPDTGTPVYDPANPNELVNTGGYTTLRQVALAGSFEGQTTLGVGVARKTPTKVTILHGTPDRIAIDIAHK